MSFYGKHTNSPSFTVTWVTFPNDIIKKYLQIVEIRWGFRIDNVTNNIKFLRGK